MEIVEVVDLTSEEKIFVFNLWNAEYPAKIADEKVSDLGGFLGDLSEVQHYFIKEDENMFGWAMTFLRDKELSFGITLDSNFHRRGYGSKLLDYLKVKNGSLCGWAIDHDTDVRLNGLNYKSPLGFYIRNGFEVFENIRMYNGKINAVKICFRRE